jgi:hypothetical protein
MLGVALQLDGRLPREVAAVGKLQHERGLVVPEVRLPGALQVALVRPVKVAL